MEILLVLGRALHCLRKQQPYLICFLEDRWLESSNNRGKRSVKLLVMRWKNWLFSNTKGCAQNRTITVVALFPKEIRNQLFCGIPSFCEIVSAVRSSIATKVSLDSPQ